ncbi:regulatory protein GemA [Vibrio mediterranei]|uniref:gp16 family protein n=1 Tax=Vibrio mediterranei TaxID=689 RepID=UPI001EFEBBC5|nr:regulatory protein GemA [Vibrio mediterranei]MCG9624616.1 regulatory protein GemA [Vibrio mediterranei]
MTDTKRLIQLIHIAKSQLALDDDTYRALLVNTTGKRSCTQMSGKQLQSVLDVMEAKGFKPKFKSRKQGGKRYSPKSGISKNAIIDVARAIFITMFKQGFVRDGSENALDKYTQRVLKKQEDKVDCIAWCNEEQASKVVESLKRWHRRVMIDVMKEKGWTIPLNKNGYPAAYHFIASTYEDRLRDSA